MQLNRKNTDEFLAGCTFRNETGQVSDFFYWAYTTAAIEDDAYDAMCDKWDIWEVEFLSGNLTGTNPDGTERLFTDVTKIPQRPRRNQ